MHFSVLAITPERPDKEALHTLLWPWCHSNPECYPKWDFFRVGGRYQARLDPDWTAEDPERIWDISQKQKRRLDVAALRARAVAHAADTYDRVQAALAGLTSRNCERRTGSGIGSRTGTPTRPSMRCGA